ncbi:MAG TPA: hypothetical protein VJ807_05745 [Gaiellaceae bacterium]|nr:hypothetical protein [Gaiellaceae bacterium]
MTRTISLITATVGAALLFAVPAYGDSWGADKAQPTTTSSSDWFERAAAAGIQQQKVEMLDARERGLGSQPVVDARSEGMNRLYGLGEYANPVDLRERALVERPGRTTSEQSVGFDARSDGLNRLYGLGEYAAPVVADDRFRIDHSNVPVTVSATSSGRDIELPQIGIGLGLVLALSIGAFLMIRHTRGRPFAH